MREILFRGKRNDNGEWVEGHLVRAVDNFDETEHFFITVAGADKLPKNEFVWFHEVDTETVGQYTGLKDKNGNRIFEGDIVHCIARLDEADCVVIFEDGEFRLVLTERHATYVTGGGFYALRSFEEEVIGNIHDHPELLGGDE